MKITGNAGITPMNTNLRAKANQGMTKTENGASFDQISLQNREKLEGDGKIQQEVASKISHEVRTHNTTSKIAQLKEEVQSGTYKMDARETAARMLLMGEIE